MFYRFLADSVVVRGPVVTPQYFNRADETRRARIDMPCPPIGLTADGPNDRYFFDAPSPVPAASGMGFDDLKGPLGEASRRVRHRMPAMDCLPCREIRAK